MTEATSPVGHHPAPSYQYAAKVDRWVDGDTVDLWVDLGWHVTIHQRCRLIGVDTPERGQDGYDEATQFSDLHAPAGSKVIVKSSLAASKYGPMLIDIIGLNNWSLSHALIDAKLGVAYFGGKKAAIVDE